MTYPGVIPPAEHGSSEIDTRPLDVVMIGADPLTTSVTPWLRQGLYGECDIHNVASFAELQDREPGLDELAVITMTVGAEGAGEDHPIHEFLAAPEHDDVRIVVLATERNISGLSSLAHNSRLDLVAYLPELQQKAFTRDMRTQLRRYRKNTRAKAGKRERATADERFALNIDMSDLEIVHEIVAIADRLLGYQPRVHFPPDVSLTTEGHRVEEVMLALSGQVSLERSSHAGDVIMHHATTGRLIGMLALTSGREAFFTSRTTTNVVAVQLTFEQLNYIWNHDAKVPALVAALFVRSFDRRLRRAEDIQIEQHELTVELERERANLATALRNLEAARTELMTQARFASLGELAAGVAHELNNPMAAIDRTSEHLFDDVCKLIELAPDRKWSRRTMAAIRASHNSKSVTTREAREIRRELEKVTKDRAVAQRLVLAGLHDPDFAKEVKRARNMDFETIEVAASIGTGLRNVSTATHRITELVASLRSYARPDGDPITDVDLHTGLDDTIRLLSHKLLNVEVKRDYHTLPPITCHPGQISQVWTNLITNAAEAMADQEDARITISTGIFDDAHVVVKIADNGPGIPEETRQNMFQPRFTTKNGQVRFGMGIGLSVVQSIVNRHQGTVDLKSSPQGTTFAVVLPIDGPADDGEIPLATEPVEPQVDLNPTDSGIMPRIMEK
ncbi:signal transduction histidine kinase [Trueperella bonasi]|uniref:histidine kinase n=1 Tax=Trueperella bonasi TaxID=312286 RepID=A0ABT9NFU5_9ACTO|nr:ATP-binding protein [Trueperella bonasi]MDP9806267.1 signal transduction histidine kinase [Trueperella bonasi]